MIDMKTVTVVIAGIGGYGNTILKNMLPKLEDWHIRLVGAVDPAWESAPLWPELAALGVPHFDSLEAFYEENSADLAILCTPIHFHESQAILALRKGSHVLCEKPTAATLPQSENMAAAAKKAGKTLNIGFQLSYVPAVWALKQDIMAGVFGKPLHLQSLTSWPRTAAYYARSWCAKRTWQGQLVLDSIAMNACAHFLHLLFFLLGDRLDTAAQPDKVEAVLCRANPIETFDTAMLRVWVGDAKLDFLASHTCEARIEPTIRLEFEKTVVCIRETAEESAIQAVFSDGTVKNYGGILPDYFHKIPHCCDIVRGTKEPVCTPETASAHLKTVDAVTQLVPVVTLEGQVTEKTVTVVPGMLTVLEQAFREGKMPWELTDRFGKPTALSLKDYIWRDTV